jgi:hypothetical protein
MRASRSTDNGDVDQAPHPLFSPDSAWWWSGTDWMPTVSPDGRWRWTGDQWMPQSRVQRPGYRIPRRVARDGAIWLVLFGLWAPVITVLVLNEVSAPVFLAIAAPLGAVAVLSTLFFGGRLGRRSQWRELGLAALAGTAELLFMYGVAMVVSPDPNNTNDQAAGIGVVIFSVPTLLIVASLLGLGGLFGRWSRRG